MSAVMIGRLVRRARAEGRKEALRDCADWITMVADLETDEAKRMAKEMLRSVRSKSSRKTA